ncbi:S41A family C-terminal processing peptidase-3 [Anseongella ginsenosidimutans]|uniref:S41A family C-terminal processing peptidase-3 n=1 Tax=Anseongella ginsenosidimutans TaxID=496056 RepID=A0A4V2UTY6_9SPHI|nr:S41 family peptidase [Anseongella ginsenosidimutans]QEC53415.1 S41 family peptidase [Anseongella ginsenosidimutans]TCS88302.1 S41A family C-terminal processing peptidase-3 [Anseongella ginsenosidimutans]
MNIKKNLLIRFFLPAILLPVAGGFAAFTLLPDLFEIRKNKEILSTLFEEVNLEYVDEVSPSRLMRTSVEAMLSSLDPYTVYFSESEVSDARMENAVAFGGIGASLHQKEDFVAIGTVHENGAAQAAGLLPGDLIVAINGRNAKGRTVEQVEAFLNGQAGAAIRLTLTRNGQQVEKTLSRKEASRSNLAWHGMIDENTGYIKLSHFGPGTAGEFGKALTELKTKSLENLVIDLRDNPGGILQEAVGLCNLFVEKGQLIVSTKGKNPANNRSFSTMAEAIDTNIAISVLLNSRSASASEIVAGAFQDLDRAVIVGQRSFGKGLVQVNKPLPYNAQLKVTIAKYYIPSGRCIQALDYTHRNPDGSVGKVPDSLVSDFKTRNGRLVRDGGGILPDIVVDRPSAPAVVQSLLDKGLIFDYATLYRQRHDSIARPRDFELTEKDYKDFTDFLSGKDYSYTTESERLLEKYRETAVTEDYFDALEDDFDSMRQQLAGAKKYDLQHHREEIKNLLEEEIAARYYYQSGRLQASFPEDRELQQALKVLDNPASYSEVLTVK